MAYGNDVPSTEINAIREQYTDSVAEFPKRDEPQQPDLLLGPFEKYHVIVDGRQMPLLSGFREGDKIWLSVDHRFICGPFSEEEARQAARLAGQAMAVISGYPHLGAASKSMPFAPMVAQIDPPAAS